MATMAWARARSATGSEDGQPAALDRRLMFLLKHSLSALAEVTEPALAPFDLDSRTFAVLTALDSEGPRSQQRLGERLRIDRSTMVSLIDALGAKAFVVRRRDPKDRRAYVVEITTEGKRALERARPADAGAEGSVLRSLSQREAARLKETLLKLIS